MDPTFDAQLQVEDVTVTAADVRLLRAIEEEGSLNAASDRLGRSFSRAHSRLEQLETATGPLVERRRGGSDGGGSEITERGRNLLGRFARLEASLSGPAGSEALVLQGEVIHREGELATVETKIGPVVALLFERLEDVQVTVPADAVTLQSPSSAPKASDTSARNRFEGTVTRIDRQESIAHVSVTIAGESVQAFVTLESVDRLGLELEGSVVVSFKATAARATRTF
jgi:molybdate transport system regulatory protein